MTLVIGTLAIAIFAHRDFGLSGCLLHQRRLGLSVAVLEQVWFLATGIAHKGLAPKGLQNGLCTLCSLVFLRKNSGGTKAAKTHRAKHPVQQRIYLDAALNQPKCFQCHNISVAVFNVC